MSEILQVSVEFSARVTHPWQLWTSGASPAAGRPREAPLWFNLQENKMLSLFNLKGNEMEEKHCVVY